MTDPQPKTFRSPAEQSALLAPFEIPMGHPLGCDHYTPRGNVMGGLYVQAQWELMNLAAFHRAAFDTVRRQDKSIAEYAQSLKSELPNPLFNDEDSEGWAELMDSRSRTAVLDADNVNAAVAAYANELCIIGLWAHCEKYLDRVLAGLTGTPGIYRWDEFLQRFKSADIDLTTLPGFDGAVECRMLNNALKHGGVITAALAAKPNFAGQASKELRDVVLNPQPYLLAVHHMMGSLLETCAWKLDGGSPPRPWRTDSFGRRVTAD